MQAIFDAVSANDESSAIAAFEQFLNSNGRQRPDLKQLRDPAKRAFYNETRHIESNCRCCLVECVRLRVTRAFAESRTPPLVSTVPPVCVDLEEELATLPARYAEQNNWN